MYGFFTCSIGAATARAAKAVAMKFLIYIPIEPCEKTESSECLFLFLFL